MSLDTLMKNIFTFANVLNQACGDRVKCWNARSVQNAYNWADYCGQVYKKVKGKPFEEELNRHIQGITVYLSPPSCLELSFSSLQDAESLLSKILLRNPLTPKQLIEFVLSRYQRSPVNTSKLIEDCSVMGRELAAMRVSEKMLNILQETSVSHCQVSTESKTLLQTLVRQRRNASSQEKFTKYARDILQRLATRKNGWGIILNLLLTEDEHYDKDVQTRADYIVLDSVHKIILEWISQVVHLQSLPTRELWTMEVELLCKVSELHLPFCRLYLQHLVDCCKDLSIDYSNSGDKLYSFRNTDNSESKDFEQLCLEFRLLVTCNCDKRKTLVKETLMRLADESLVNVFRDINGVLSDVS